MLFIHLILIFVAYLSCFSPISSFLIQIRLLWLFRALFSLFLTDDSSNIAKLPKSRDDSQTHQDSCVDSEKTLYRLSVERRRTYARIFHHRIISWSQRIVRVSKSLLKLSFYVGSRILHSEETTKRRAILKLYCDTKQRTIQFWLTTLKMATPEQNTHPGSTVGFLLLQCSSGVVRHPRDLQVSVATRCFYRVLIFVSS